MMKKLITWGALMAIALTPLAAQAHTSQSWHQLTPSQRGLRIVSAALSGIGTTGYNCKKWLQLKVIKDVTGGHVTLPVNVSEPGDRWVDDPTGHITTVGKDFSQARAGDIIQMITRFAISGELTSHTAVIAEVSSRRLVLVESNYAIKNTVTKRDLTVDSFKKSTVSNQYTIYRVN